MMKRFAPALLLALFFCFLPSALRAQTSVYGAISVANYGYSQNSNDLYAKNDVVGFTGGVTYLFPHASRLKFGIDGRVDGSPGVNGGEAGFASFRIAFVPRQNRVSPYFQVGSGFITTTYATGVCGLSCFTLQNRYSGGAVDLGVGFNVRTGTHFFIRPLEIMSSAGSHVGHANIGTGLGYTF